MQTKTKVILFVVLVILLVIDYYVILPKFIFLLGWFLLGAFATAGPIVGMFFLIRSFFTKNPNPKP